ncbi:Hypothetical protein NTJ_08472 [Nesidiocoris tenuis]|uniref:Uncharacterized protein n=1 Tax=Nesidiocoris tenuis TaxID=355587 RepID=A0ABN7AUN5_9HEMI|nr:Hypothetical protein NTJ_08472 [Nesidiocoris tenuis]
MSIFRGAARKFIALNQRYPLSGRVIIGKIGENDVKTEMKIADVSPPNSSGLASVHSSKQNETGKENCAVKVDVSKSTGNLAIDVSWATLKDKWADIEKKLPGWQVKISNTMQSVQDFVNSKILK